MKTWTITEGADLFKELQLIDIQEAVFDLTGHTVTCHLRSAPRGRKLATAAVNVTAQATGELSLTITAADIIAAPDTSFLDLLVKRTSDSHKIFSDKIMLVKEGGITQDG